MDKTINSWVIDYSVEHPKPADYYPTSANNWTNWGTNCCNTERMIQNATCVYFGPALQKNGKDGQWKCKCCVELEVLRRAAGARPLAPRPTMRRRA